MQRSWAQQLMKKIENPVEESKRKDLGWRSKGSKINIT